MSGEAWLYLLAVLINAVNLFLQVFFTIMYSDLEWYVTVPRRRSCALPSLQTPFLRSYSLCLCIILLSTKLAEADHFISTPHSDYINPIDLCNRLNSYILPEAGVHAFLTALFLINGYWIALVLNLPLIAYNAKK